VRQTDHFRAVADVPEPRRRIHSASNPGESPRTAGTVTDFGLADFVERIGSHELAGTPGYMAPEQLTRGPASIKSDIYALGLVLFEIFTGGRGASRR
jgi:serine/threonine protein kinase